MNSWARKTGVEDSADFSKRLRDMTGFGGQEGLEGAQQQHRANRGAIGENEGRRQSISISNKAQLRKKYDAWTTRRYHWSKATSRPR